MIIISFCHKNDYKLIKLKVTGHANYSVKGSDIVCSAVSILIDCYLYGLEQQLKAKIYGNLSNGICDVEVVIPHKAKDMSKVIFEMFKGAFRRLENSYKGYVCLE